MRVNQVVYDDSLPIDGYGPGFFRVGGQVHHGGVLVLGAGVKTWAGYDDTSILLAEKETIDVLFVGTGAEIAPLPAAFRELLEAAGVGVESMNSPSACRTFNVLLSEGRRVALAALPV